jgi:hypothetical protein
MLKSKQINTDKWDLDKPDNRPTWLLKLIEWWYDQFPYKWWEAVYTKYRRIKRHIRWVRECLQYTWDFDAHGCFTLMRYQLERTKICIEKGYHVEEPNETKSLRIAIKLLKRIEDEKHEEECWNRIESKYGELITNWSYDGASRIAYHAFETEENREECREFSRQQYEIAATRRERELVLFWKIFTKYHRLWWD